MRPKDADKKEPCLCLSVQDLRTQFSEQHNKLQAEKDAIQAEFERVKADLLARCKQAEDEVSVGRLGLVVSGRTPVRFPASAHLSLE